MDADRLKTQASEWLELMIRMQALASRSPEQVAAAAGDELTFADINSFMEAYLKSLSEWMRDPVGTMERAQHMWFDWARAWQNAWLGGHEAPRDRRFRDPRWESDPYTRGLRDSHLALEKAADELLAELPEGSKDTLRMKFYTRQFLSAIAPSNFLMLNPAARARFLETDGESLLAGFRNLVEDFERGEGRLSISTSDPDAFEFGRDLATTPGKVIYENALMQLIQFSPLTETQKKRPMLFVPAWINKYYILDLRPENSVVRYLLEKGHTVFLISWVNPTEEHADMSFEDYMTLGPLAALDAMGEATGEKEFDILGFCIGGILVTATLALLAARKDKRVATATTFATLVDFVDVGELGIFIDRGRLDMLRAHMKETGFLEQYHLQNLFSMMRENDLVWSFHVMNYLMGHKPPAFDLLFWNADSTRLPAKMLLWYIEKIYIENGLRRPGFLSLGGTPIDISKIEVPYFVIATKEDHIAPWPSIYPATKLLGGEVKFVLGESGHIAGIINPPGPRPKYGYWVRDDYPENPEEWLAGAESHKGSWWPAWAEWLDAHASGETVPARRPEDGKLAPIEDAPGRYVRAK